MGYTCRLSRFYREIYIYSPGLKIYVYVILKLPESFKASSEFKVLVTIYQNMYVLNPCPCIVETCLSMGIKLIIINLCKTSSQPFEVTKSELTSVPDKTHCACAGKEAGKHAASAASQQRVVPLQGVRLQGTRKEMYIAC